MKKIAAILVFGTQRMRKLGEFISNVAAPQHTEFRVLDLHYRRLQQALINALPWIIFTSGSNSPVIATNQKFIAYIIIDVTKH